MRLRRAALVLCLAVAGCGDGDQRDVPVVEVSPGASELSGGIAGDCNAPGRNISVVCTIARPQSRASIRVTTAGTNQWAWFAGPADALPVPPPYEAVNGACTEPAWDEWLRTNEEIFLPNPSVVVSMEAGDADLLVITKVEVLIFTRAEREAGGGTWIRCAWGGGFDTFYRVTVDTLTRTATVEESSVQSDGRRYPIPPGSITLAEKGHATVDIGVRSPTGYRYEGGIRITASVNGTPAVYQIGTRAAPLRWLTPAEPEDGRAYVGWDQQKREWVEDYEPFA